MCVQPDFFVSRKYILISVRAIVARCEWKSAHERFEDSRNRNGIRSRDDYPRIHVLETRWRLSEDRVIEERGAATSQNLARKLYDLCAANRFIFNFT